MAQYGLIADVGGTNIRLALVHLTDGSISQINKYLCADFTDIADVISLYLQQSGQEVSHACVAIACPVDDDCISMTNHSWSFSKRAVQNRLGLKSFQVINDYTAIAMALPVLSSEQKIQVGGDVAQPEAPIAVYGPGTGLGVAHLACYKGDYIPLPGEGGHADFAPTSELQSQIFSQLAERFGHVSVERLLSGPGLVNIYQAICSIYGVDVKAQQPADVTGAALSGSCDICRKALEVFCQVMGSFGGNLALNMGAFGGVYIAGGIITRFTDFFTDSEFREFFDGKGRLSGFCEKVPVYLITEEQPGLIGAGAQLRQSMGYKI